jgi:competence protein ComEC
VLFETPAALRPLHVAFLSLPLVIVSLAFLVGLLPGLRYGPGMAAFAVVAALAAGLLAMIRPAAAPGQPYRRLPPALLLTFALVGAALGAGGHRDALTDCRTRFADGAHLTLRGVLAANAPGRVGEEAGPAPLVPVVIEEAHQGRRPVPGCAGEVRVRLPREHGPLRGGAEVALRGEWLRFAEPVVPSAWPRDPAFAGMLTARSFTLTAAPALRAHPLLTLRGRTEAHLHRIFPRHGAFADALLLGRREGLDPELRQRFAESGLVHLLAISGTHVALLAGALLLLGRVLRLPRRVLTWTTLGLMTLYLGVIGAPPSAVRSGIMLGLALCGVLLQRPSASLPIVAAAGLVILAADPLAALDPGFQLSFAGVLGILLLRGAMLKRIPRKWRATPPGRLLTESLVVSVAAFLATAPITAFHFGQVAPVAILANLPAIPLTSLALVGICVAAMVEPLVPPLGRMFADGAGVALDLLGWVAARAAELPWGHAEVSPPQWWIWAGAGLAAFLALDASVRLRERVRWTVALGAACAAFLVLPVVAARPASGLEIHFLDVGQGDAVALRTPGDRWVLIDAGPRAERYDAGERRVLPFLRAHRARRLEALILTHPDADHIGGARAVLEGMEVKWLIEPGLPVGKPLYLETLRAAEARRVPWAAARAGRALRLDGVELELLWPGESSLDATVEANEISAVVRLRYGQFTALLTGDVGAGVEEELAARHGEALRAVVLKAGHHGSRTSTSEALLDAVRPEMVVVSAGRRNRYGHPAPEVLARLRKRGIAVARTDGEGTVSLRVEAGGAWKRVSR